MQNGKHPLRALIVDDEPPARRRLKKLLQPLQDEGAVRLLGEAADGVEALEKLRTLDVDLAFLDIRMPELSGFDVLEQIDRDDRPAVVFTTAYDSYALRAFEANAVDYLLKPISKERLAESVERARRLRQDVVGSDVSDERLEKLLRWLREHDESEGDNAPPLSTDASPPREYVRQLSVPYRDRILLVPVDRVISAEISEGITRIYVLEDDLKGNRRLRQHVVNYTLDQLESSLSPDRFMRVHRSAIVQLDHIQELIPWFSGRYKLILPDEHEVIASRERSKQLKDTLMI